MGGIGAYLCCYSKSIMAMNLIDDKFRLVGKVEARREV